MDTKGRESFRYCPETRLLTAFPVPDSIAIVSLWLSGKHRGAAEKDSTRTVGQYQWANIEADVKLMADAIEQGRLIHVYGGGLANINPIMETGLSVFNRALCWSG